MPHV
jgi:hypothetical protein